MSPQRINMPDSLEGCLNPEQLQRALLRLAGVNEISILHNHTKAVGMLLFLIHDWVGNASQWCESLSLKEARILL